MSADRKERHRQFLSRAGDWASRFSADDGKRAQRVGLLWVAGMVIIIAVAIVGSMCGWVFPESG